MPAVFAAMIAGTVVCDKDHCGNTVRLEGGAAIAASAEAGLAWLAAMSLGGMRAQHAMPD